MARLIDPAAIDRPTPRPGGDIARLRIAGGGEEVGQAVASFGGNMQEIFKSIDESLTKARQASQLSDAMSKATTEINDLELSFQKDQDFKTAPTRFVKQSEEIRKKHESVIDDPLVKGSFTRQYNRLLEAKRINVIQIAAKQEGDYNVAALDDGLNTYATVAANAVNVGEREIVLNEARLSIERMRQGGWITDIDAGKRERDFLTKIDTSIVLRDMQADPIVTATKLAIAADYAPNIDPVARERMIDNALRRADAFSSKTERDAEKARKANAEVLMKDAFDRLSTGTLDRQRIEEIRPFIDQNEYHSLLKALDPRETKDDPEAYARLQQLSYENPGEAERAAYNFHRMGKITNETLSSTLTRARSVSRQGGPDTEYERSRQYITNALKPSEFTMDPASSARYAIAIREYDDFASKGNRTDEQLRIEANRILKKLSMVDMVDLAKKTSASARNDPQKQIDALKEEADKLGKAYEEDKITATEYNRKLAELNKARKAAVEALLRGIENGE